MHLHMPTMRRALLPTAFVALALLLAWSVPGTAAAHGATRAASGSGTITGTVLNGSKGNAPVAGQTVTLDMYVSHAQTQSAATTTTDAHGHFSFGNLDGSGSTIYQLDVKYANGDFTGATIDFASSPTVDQTITVYDTTSDPSALSVTNTTMLFSPPNTQTGLIPVGVFITFKNSGKLAFVSSAAPGAAGGAPTGGMPTSLLRFALPPGAQNLTLGAGFTNVQAMQVDKGFAALATIPPGTTQFAYVYDLPYTGTDYHFQFQAVYPTAQVTLLVPTNVLVDDGDYAAKPPVQALGQQYQLLEADSVQPGEVLKMRLWDLPVPGEQADLDQRALLILAAVLALLMALLVGLYLKRGNLAVALRLLPASALAKPAGSRGSQGRDAERKRLLKQLLALEKQHTAGQLEDAEYQRRRGNTRRKLKSLLAENIATEPKRASVERKPATKGESGLARAAGAKGSAPTPDETAEVVGSAPTESIDHPGTVAIASLSGADSTLEATDANVDADTTADAGDVEASPAAPAVTGDDVGALPAAPARAGGCVPASAKSTRRRAPVGGRR